MPALAYCRSSLAALPGSSRSCMTMYMFVRVEDVPEVCYWICTPLPDHVLSCDKQYNYVNELAWWPFHIREVEKPAMEGVSHSLVESL